MRRDLHPTGHPLLTGAAAKLSEEEMAEASEAAIDLLGIREGRFSDDGQLTARRAIAIQINYTLARGVTGAVLESDGRGGKSETFRKDVRSAEAVSIIRSLRGSDGWGGGLISRRLSP